MEICEPSDNCIKNCLFVLTRIVLHNKETAYEVFKCSRLIEVIFKILSNSSTISSKQTYKVHALRFLKFICIAGKHMAATLVSFFLYLCKNYAGPWSRAQKAYFMQILF